MVLQETLMIPPSCGTILNRNLSETGFLRKCNAYKFANSISILYFKTGARPDSGSAKQGKINRFYGRHTGPTRPFFKPVSC